jgi:hypothetical protein
MLVISGYSQQADNKPVDISPKQPSIKKQNDYEDLAVRYTLEILSKDASLLNLSKMRIHNDDQAEGLPWMHNYTPQQRKQYVTTVDLVEKFDMEWVTDIAVYIYPSFQLLNKLDYCTAFIMELTKDSEKYKVLRFVQRI